MIGHRQAILGVQDVENPYFSRDHPESSTNEKMVTVYVNLRESSLRTLYAHGKLSESQFEAGKHFQRCYEAFVGLRRGSILERVDGCGFAIPERKEAARRELGRCRKMLGEHGYVLVAKVCGEGWHIKDLYRGDRPAQETMNYMLRLHLTSLASMWGY